jgi:hypothetical protein
LARDLTRRLGTEATTPKSMVNVAGRPFLDTLIDEIVRYDAFEEILLVAGHQAERVLARYAGAVRGRARLTIAPEREPLGIAGALAHAAGLLQKRFLLLEGASFSISIFSIWCGVRAPASFIWLCAPTSSTTDPIVLSSTTTGFRIRRSWPWCNRSGQCRGLCDRPLYC